MVFRATYADIITPEQMNYMIDWMYNPFQIVIGQIIVDGVMPLCNHLTNKCLL